MNLEELKFPSYDKRKCADELEILQHRFMACQLGIPQSGNRAVIVVEGADASGIGGKDAV